MGRDALATSGVPACAPAQNSLNPSPVLLDVTVGAGNGPDFEKCSATIALKGYTVDEPTMEMTSWPLPGFAAILGAQRKPKAVHNRKYLKRLSIIA
jgi:hypothetical protein